MPDRERFLEKIAECLELPEVLPDYEFRNGADWSSLQGFAILVTLETEFGRRMQVDEFQTLHTVAELARACGIEGI